MLTRFLTSALLAGLCLLAAPFASAQQSPVSGGTVRAIGGSGFSLATVERVATGVGAMTVVSGKTDSYDYSEAVYRKFSGTWAGLGGAFISGETGVRGEILSLAISSGGVIHAAGSFRFVDGRAVSTVARWNGSEWRQMGSGLNAGSVTTLRFAPDGTLYAVYRLPRSVDTGYLIPQQVLRWTGAAWEAVGETSFLEGPGDCQALGFGPDGSLYACMPDASRWNGTAWVSLTAAPLSRVRDILVTDDGAVHAFGVFQEWDGRSLNGAARLVGSEWERMGLGLEGGVTSAALAADGSIWAAGVMGWDRALARWTGTSWQQMEDGASGGGTLQSLSAGTTGGIVGGGRLLETPGVVRNVVREYTATTAADLSISFDAPVRDLDIAADGSVLAAGAFTVTPDTDVDYAARWRDGAWSALPNVPIRKLDVIAAGDGDDFFAAGLYSQNSTQTSQAIYDVSAGTATEIGGTVVSGSYPAFSDLLVTNDGALLVAGRFEYVYTASGRGIARYDGTFTRLGDATADFTQGVAQAPDGTVYALAGNALLRLNGPGWETLGQADNRPDDVHVGADGAVYVAGEFSSIGGIAATNAARWENGAWSPLGDGPGWRVREIRTSANGAPTACGGGIARWNGDAWIQDVTITPGGTVLACVFTLSGDLVFGGDFEEANGVNAPYIALLADPGVVTTDPTPNADGLTLTLAPNPSAGSAVALLSGVKVPGEVAVYDALGRQVARIAVGAALTQVALPTAGLAPGVYVVQITTGDTVESRRLVITR